MANRSRGKESLGFFDSNEQIHKVADDPEDVLITDDCTGWLDQAESNSWFVVGHTRFSTQGKVCNENSHPFHYGHVIGSHNGIVEAPHNYEVDSEYAIDLLDTHESNYQKALSQVYGYWTLGWFDNRTNELYISMYDNSCAIAKYRGAWYFSSDSDHLMAAIGSREVIILESGQTVSFDCNGNMKWRKKFKSNLQYNYKHDSRTSGYSVSNSYEYDEPTGNWQAKDDSKISVNDPDNFARDYDEEFRNIWEEYTHEYEGV